MILSDLQDGFSQIVISDCCQGDSTQMISYLKFVFVWLFLLDLSSYALELIYLWNFTICGPLPAVHWQVICYGSTFILLSGQVQCPEGLLEDYSACTGAALYGSADDEWVFHFRLSEEIPPEFEPVNEEDEEDEDEENDEEDDEDEDDEEDDEEDEFDDAQEHPVDDKNEDDKNEAANNLIINNLFLKTSTMGDRLHNTETHEHYVSTFK